MKSFTRQHLSALLAVVQGLYYSEVVITMAISTTDSHEVKILLANLMNGLSTCDMRMSLRHFICDELSKLSH